MNLRREVQTILGWGYRHALFYNFPNGLRFALSEGGSQLDQALTALRKASVVCDHIFAGEEQMLVHLEAHLPQSHCGSRTALRELRTAGIIVPRVREVWIEVDAPTETDDDANELLCCAFEVPVAKLQNLLWCAITTDLGPLRPKPRCRVYLLNLNKGIVVHPYDDRGMDVISRNASALAGLFERHGALLFKYDIEAMRQKFAPHSA
jgi:hypothetical protein